MPEWPAKDFDYKAELAKRKLRQVSFDVWEDEDDIDDEGVTKVYEITHFSGKCDYFARVGLTRRLLQAYIETQKVKLSTLGRKKGSLVIQIWQSLMKYSYTRC